MVSTETDTSAQIVPDMDDKQHSSDIAMSMKTEGLPSSSTHTPSNAATTPLHLSFNPIHPESHSTHVPNPVHPVAASIAFHGSPIHVATSPVLPGPVSFQGSPVHIATSPIHAGPISFHTTSLNSSSGQQLILNSDLSSAYLLTPLTPSLSSGGNLGAFFATPSPPSNSLLNTSPTHSLGSSSSPVNIPTSPHSHANTHRPVGPSQSVDSYFSSRLHANPTPGGPSALSTTSPSPASSLHVRPTSLLSSSTQHSRNIALPSVSETGRISVGLFSSGPGSSGFVVSSPLESVMTVRSSAEPAVDGEHNRHTFTSGDTATTPRTSAPRTHRRRRNSSSDLNSTRVRRSSLGCHALSPSASLESTSFESATHAPHHGRMRRRSHDYHMDGRSRISRSASREPYTLNPQ